jgi:hypothetical protein
MDPPLDFSLLPGRQRAPEQRSFAYWWRPGGMYLNLYLWLQNTMLAPVLFNGAFNLPVPMIPWEQLIAFTALYCGLYMGGHTVKAIFGDRFAAR